MSEYTEQFASALKRKYDQKDAELSNDMAKNAANNAAAGQRQDSINNTSIKNNTDDIASKANYYGAAANDYNAKAGKTKAETIKQGFDNDLQQATQPGIISAVNVGSDSKIAQLRTTKTAAQDMQSDIMRGAIERGYQVGIDGSISNGAGNWIKQNFPGKQGVADLSDSVVSKEVTALKESTKNGNSDYYETNPGKIMESERGQPLGDIPGSLGFKDTRGRGRQLRSPEKLAVAGSRALAGVAGNYLMNIDKGFK